MIRLAYVEPPNIVWQGEVPNAFPLPLVGEEIVIGEKCYLVMVRIWDLSPTQKGISWDMGVNIQIKEIG